MEALQNKLGRNKVVTPKQKPEGIVNIKDIEAVATPEEVKQAIEKVLGHKEWANNIHIASLRKGFVGTLNATVFL